MNTTAIVNELTEGLQAVQATNIEVKQNEPQCDTYGLVTAETHITLLAKIMRPEMDTMEFRIEFYESETQGRKYCLHFDSLDLSYSYLAAHETLAKVKDLIDRFTKLFTASAIRIDDSIPTPVNIHGHCNSTSYYRIDHDAYLDTK